MRKRNCAVCQWCGNKAAYTDCSKGCTPPDDARCEVLKGWLSVSRWKGAGNVDYYDFCSLFCLQRWIDGQVPKIPQAFLKEFEEE